jgi:hypothetical protein
MRAMRLAFVFVTACACGSSGKKGTGPGSDAGATCDGIKAHVEELYKAVASGDHADEEVADNTQMVLDDCAANPDKVANCTMKAKSAADLEARCLIPLDEEGSEGDQFKGGK